MQFSLWVFTNRIFSQAQTASQKLFWHNSVWIWQPIWKWLSESPLPKCNYPAPVVRQFVMNKLPFLCWYRGCCLPFFILRQWLFTQSSRSSHSSCYIPAMLQLAANADLWLKQKPRDQWLSHNYQSPCRSRKRTGARQFVIVSVLGTHRRFSVINTTANSSWTFCKLQI